MEERFPWSKMLAFSLINSSFLDPSREAKFHSETNVRSPRKMVVSKFGISKLPGGLLSFFELLVSGRVGKSQETEWLNECPVNYSWLDNPPWFPDKYHPKWVGFSIQLC